MSTATGFYVLLWFLGILALIGVAGAIVVWVAWQIIGANRGRGAQHVDRDAPSPDGDALRGR